MLEYSGGIDVKGKGMMDTYLWAPPPQGSAAEAVAVAASDRLSGQGQHPHLQCPRQQESPPADNIISSFQNWFMEDPPRPASTPVQSPSQPLGQPPSRSKRNSQGLPSLLSLAETKALDASMSLSEGAIAGTQLNLRMFSAPKPASTLSQIVAASLSSVRSSLEGARAVRTTGPATPPPPREKVLGLLNATLRLLDATSGAKAEVGAVGARIPGATAWRPSEAGCSRGGGRGGTKSGVPEGPPDS